MPAEDWLDLVAAVEDTAEELGRKVVLEGYLPPRDPRLLHFSVTPDPGVIEVNVHPAHQLDRDRGARHRELYEEARQVGLATEKFMLDGRHVGTGGGNHVVMGAAGARGQPVPAPARSAEVAARLLAQPPEPVVTCSAACSSGPPASIRASTRRGRTAWPNWRSRSRRSSPEQEVPPWLVDRLFRNMLADMTGNTHRTEFCIDKLYAPETASGRLGLVEFRALEMPPHARMAAAQMLLMRAAVAAFWQAPYERRLVRWGTRLHDDFMLPHYVEQDFADVLEELRELGYRFDPAWFAPHFEFRFPRIGEVTVRGTTLELRHALEPWHVLGEEPAAGGTVRYVDSSVERVQARVSGWVDERYVLACNGGAVPLTPTERAGEYRRRRALQGVAAAVSALHPTIPAQAPLVFDVYDRWTGRSLGGLTHHVSHPGGRNYERFPVNANEAEARRRARFFPIGHTPGRWRSPS